MSPTKQDGKRSARKRNSVVTPLGILLLLTLLLAPAQAQTYTQIHNFSGQGDGAQPDAGLTRDAAGGFYGTTSLGGSSGCGGGGCGAVFRLKASGSRWILTKLYSFQGGNDGANPLAGVVLGPDGNLYGTTNAGGTGCGSAGCGTVYRLRPPARACASLLCPWTETVLYRFSGGADGAGPLYGALIMDHSGSLYGTTLNGGVHGSGVVYQLTPSGGGWTESVLCSFSNGDDGAFPASGLTLDTAGSLYGTTQYGGTLNQGTVYRLTPSGSEWIKTVLTNFESGERQPIGGLTFDPSGNLYGTTYLGGTQGGGTVYKLQPSGGGWTDTVLRSFPGDGGPLASMTMDMAGDLYGTAATVDSAGLVFKLSPSGGAWRYTELHSFSGSDGSFPLSNVTLDASGDLYGTTSVGGPSGKGVIWKIMP